VVLLLSHGDEDPAFAFSTSFLDLRKGLYDATRRARRDATQERAIPAPNNAMARKTRWTRAVSRDIDLGLKGVKEELAQQQAS
jgi:hypothetical protein